jgi:hypothetical protein
MPSALSKMQTPGETVTNYLYDIIQNNGIFPPEWGSDLGKKLCEHVLKGGQLFITMSEGVPVSVGPRNSWDVKGIYKGCLGDAVLVWIAEYLQDHAPRQIVSSHAYTAPGRFTASKFKKIMAEHHSGQFSYKTVDGTFYISIHSDDPYFTQKMLDDLVGKVDEFKVVVADRLPKSEHPQSNGRGRAQRCGFGFDVGTVGFSSESPQTVWNFEPNISGTAKGDGEFTGEKQSPPSVEEPFSPDDGKGLDLEDAVGVECPEQNEIRCTEVRPVPSEEPVASEVAATHVPVVSDFYMPQQQPPPQQQQQLIPCFGCFQFTSLLTAGNLQNASQHETIADQRATIADQRATIADQRATIADQRATIADQHAKIAQLQKAPTISEVQ